MFYIDAPLRRNRDMPNAAQVLAMAAALKPVGKVRVTAESVAECYRFWLFLPLSLLHAVSKRLRQAAATGKM
jgi:hypothetical protein